MHGKPTDNGSGPLTLAEVLCQRAGEFPDRMAFVYQDEAAPPVEWTYRDLDARAQAIAAWLAERTEMGDRALLVYPPGLEFIAAFFGCLYTGVLPVPATYPKPRRPQPRVDSIVQDCQPRLALTQGSALRGLCLDQYSPAVGSLAWEATDQIAFQRTADFTPAKRQADDLAFLQYTSGSTSEPRGVMVTHANLLHNLETIRAAFGIAPSGTADRIETSVFWLPAYHDMGLIGGILAPLYVGGTSHLLAPTTFLRRPLSWLETLSRTAASISGAPNFGYELCVRKTTPAQRAELDLHHWRLAFCGAEPIHPTTLEEFASAFSLAGFRSQAFYPCYGLAENTLLVTGGEHASEPCVLHVDRRQLRNNQVACVDASHVDAWALVSCGKSRNGQGVAIVDPQSQRVCPDGDIGEIWVRGESVARGYWNQDSLSRETFQARSTNGDTSNGAPGPYLRTGDLGFQWEDQLYVTSRLKDVIIIRGRNHYPQDIERTAQASHAAVDLGAAFSVQKERQEQLVVVHQVHREHRRSNLEQVLQAIRTAIVEEHELDPDVIALIRPASLPLTSSGKVQRRQCLEKFLAGELSICAQWTNPAGSDEDRSNCDSPQASLQARPQFLEHLPQAEPARLAREVQAWLIAWLASRVGMPAASLRPTTAFAELGIDSLTAVEISQELEQTLGLPLPPMVVWSCPTPEALSQYLVEQLTSEAGNSPSSDVARG